MIGRAPVGIPTAPAKADHPNKTFGLSSDDTNGRIKSSRLTLFNHNLVHDVAITPHYGCLSYKIDSSAQLFRDSERASCVSGSFNQRIFQMNFPLIIFGGVVALGWTSRLPHPSDAMLQSADAPTPLSALAECRRLESPTLRLDCYDAAVQALETAQAQGNVVLLDRAAIEESQRRSFGFNISTFNPFAGGDGPVPVDEVTSTLKAARQIPPGRKWLITLEDGSTWLQTDTSTPYITRPQGQPVRIRRASMGSYLMTVANSAAFSVRRQNSD